MFKLCVFIEIDSSILLVNRGDVDLRHEPHLWGLNWVLVTTNELQHVDAIVEVSVSWSNDSSIPVCEGLVIAFIESIRDASIGEVSFFSLFQFVIKLEGSWFYEKERLVILVRVKLADRNRDSMDSS